MRKSDHIGRCGFCRNEGVPLTRVNNLYPAFRNLVDVYVRSSEEVAPREEAWHIGKPLAWLIEEDWGIFSRRCVNTGKDSVLLSAILRSAGRIENEATAEFEPRKLYVWRGRLTSTSPFKAWDEFRQSVIANANAVPKLPMELSLYIERITELLPTGSELFRAVPGWEKEENGERIPWTIGPPPLALVAHIGPGRANSAGERMAYCANEERTAITEVRPARGSLVSVGKVQLLNDQRVANLGTLLMPPNPFTTKNLWYEIEELGLLNGFAQDLAQPLRRNDDIKEYLPTQKLSRMIRDCGIGGIRYPSALDPNGKNTVLFDPEVVKPLTKRLIEVTKTAIEYRDFEAHKATEG